MKLSTDHIFLINEALKAHAETLLARSHATAADQVTSDYWKKEAASAHQLSLLFQDAISVQVETASLQPATPSTAAVSSATAEEVLAAHRHHLQAEEALLSKVRQRAKATPPPAATAVPAPESDAPSMMQTPEAQPSRPLQSAADAPTTPAPDSSAATNPTAPSSGTVNQSHLGTTPPAPETQPASGHQDSCSPPAQSTQPLESPGSIPSKIHSSAHDGDACGDINCDGHCPAPAQPDLRPHLIQIIDRCGSVMNARRKVILASPESKQAAARYLGVSQEQLNYAISRRVRTRLQAAA